MDENTITVPMSRDAALYLSMLLEDQLLSISDTSISLQLEPMRRAYEDVKEEIEQALGRVQFVT